MDSYNGGFPPIKYCQTDIKKQKTDKERFYSNEIKQNINIRQILSDSKKKPIIIDEANNDDLQVVDTL